MQDPYLQIKYKAIYKKTESIEKKGLGKEKEILRLNREDD